MGNRKKKYYADSEKKINRGIPVFLEKKKKITKIGSGCLDGGTLRCIIMSFHKLISAVFLMMIIVFFSYRKNERHFSLFNSYC